MDFWSIAPVDVGRVSWVDVADAMVVSPIWGILLTGFGLTAISL